MTPTPTATPTPTPTPTPEPILSREIIEKYKITDQDLDQITHVVIVGERAEFTRNGDGVVNMSDLASRGSNENGAVWYSNEDGHEMVRTTYDDLWFLDRMPNLVHIDIAYAELANLPDLKPLEKLSHVWVSDCILPDLKWLEGSTVRHFLFNSSGDQDFSPLTSCPRLNHVQLDFWTCRNADLSGFAPPKLTELDLANGYDIQTLDLNALSACKNLATINFENIPLRDISFVQDKEYLRFIRLSRIQELSDLSPLGGLTGLKSLSVNECDSVRDYSPIGGCTGLEELGLNIRWDRRIQNVDWIANMPNIQDIGLYGCKLKDVNFLDSIPQDRQIHFGFAGSLGDSSALGRHKKYGYVHVNPENGIYAPVANDLKDAEIWHLMLYKIEKIDLSMLPKVKNRLEIVGGKLENLRGLPEMDIRELVLQDPQRLKTLEGIESLTQLHEDGMLTIEIDGCPRLTDYSALNGKKLKNIVFSCTYMLPDLSTFETKDLTLDYIEGLDDLSCLEALDPAKRIDLAVFSDTITNLLPASRLRGNKIRVSPQLGEQAQAFVDEKYYNEMEISYPDHSWKQSEFGFTLLNLEEIDELPAAVLAKVGQLILAGDTVVDLEHMEMGYDWDGQNNRNQWFVKYRDSDEKIPVPMGTVTDLSRIAKLTGLKQLQVMCQPMENLEGLDGMEQLEWVYFEDCDRLSDISTLFTLESVHEIDVRNAPVGSIQGIQNLPGLTYLNLNNTLVTDIMPLAQCDLSSAQESGGLSLTVQGKEPVEDLSPLDNIKSFNKMFMNEREAKTWLPHMQGATVKELSISTLPSEAVPLLDGINVEQLNYNNFVLSRLEDLETVPDQMLSGIRSLMILGNEIADPSQADYDHHWDNQQRREIPVVSKWQTGEQYPIEQGTVTDLSGLARLGSLEELTIVAQPLEDLGPILQLGALKTLRINFCDQVKDLTPVFGNRNIQRLDIDYCKGITSIQGIGEMKNLCFLSLGSSINDLSPMEEIDYSFAMKEQNGFRFKTINEKTRSFAPLKAVPCFSELDLGGMNNTKWISELKESRILSLKYMGFSKQKDFETFVSQHPELEELNISWNGKLTDLSMLPDMPNLKRVQISVGMEKAEQTLEGKEYSFELVKEGQ